MKNILTIYVILFVIFSSVAVYFNICSIYINNVTQSGIKTGYFAEIPWYIAH